MKKLLLISLKPLRDQYSQKIDAAERSWSFACKNRDYLFTPSDPKNIKKILRNYSEVIDTIIISGGGGISKKIINSIKKNNSRNFSSLVFKNSDYDRDLTETFLIKYCIKNSIRLVGICRGMQLINIFFGGTLSKIDNHSGTTHLIELRNRYNYKIKINHKFSVNSYHDYGITKTDLSKDLVSIAQDLNGNSEILKHSKYNIYGIMYHPERKKNSKDAIKFFNHLIKK